MKLIGTVLGITALAMGLSTASGQEKAASTMRWHTHYHTVGTGHLYQGRFKAFPIQADEHLYTVLRYVERNPLRANLVQRAEDWRWSSLWQSLQETPPEWLHAWPVPRPTNWADLVNQAQTEAEIEALRRSVTRGAPFGAPAWQRGTVTRLGLQRGRRS